MKNTRLLKWFFYPLVLLLLPAAGLLFLLVTENGFRLLLHTGDYLAGPLFSVEQVQGRLIGNWRLQKVQVHIDDTVDLAIDELRFNWQPGALAEKELLINSFKIEGFVLHLAGSNEAKSENGPIILSDVFLPLGIRVKDLLIKDAEIFFSGDSAPFIVNELGLSASVHDDQVRIGRLKLDTPDYGGDLQGTAQLSSNWPLSISCDWRVTDSGIGNLSGSVQAEGDLETLSVTVKLATPARAEVQGKLTNILDELHWQAAGRTDPFQLSDIQVNLPIDGTLVVEASGTIETYGGTLAADVRYEGYTRIQASAEVQGDYTELTIHSLRFLLDEASLTARGKIGWAGGFSWQVEVEGEQLDPAPFTPDWPGRIDGLITSRGKWAADRWTAELDIQQLQGDLRGFPLIGTGRAELDGSTLILDEIHLQSGSSYLLLNGRANSELDISLDAGSGDLATLVPEGSGVFQLQGSVSGSREQPRLAFTLSGSNLQMEEYALQNLKGVVNVDLAGEGSTEADIEAEGIDLKGEIISKARLQVQGNLEKHQAELIITGSPGSVQLAAAGALVDHHWQGVLSGLLLQSRQFGDWQIQDSVSLQLSNKQAEISQLTLVQDQVQVSVTGEWQQSVGWQVQGAVDNFSLHLLNEWDLVTPELKGVLTLSALARGRGSVPDTVELKAAVPEISLHIQDEEGRSRVFQWTGNSLQTNLLDGKAQLTAQTLFQDGSTANLDLAVANCCDFGWPEEMLLDGKLALNFKDISPLGPLSGSIVSGKGGFAGSFALQGTVAVPVLQGTMTLVDGEMEIPDAGVAVQELELTVSGDRSAGRVGLTLSSGEGMLKAEGVVKQDSEKQWQADFTVKGEGFQVVNLTEYQASVTPDLSLVHGPTGTVLSGTVTIAKARIAPVGFQSSVSPSRDVVIIDADGTEGKSGLPLTLDINVVMGNEVRVDAFGVKGYLDGRLRIKQKPGRVVTGTGSLNLKDGTFVFKSTQLKINRGLVFYQGGPIDDPGLDIQATRQFGNQEVGVRMTGNVSRMELNLFSNPYMDESDILTSLLAGRDMSRSDDQEGSLLGAAAGLGLGAGGDFLGDLTEKTGFDVSLAEGEEVSGISLVVGKEIYKDLYISYGKGLTDSAGTFKARYEMKYGFSVQTETTSEASGSDLFWSLER